MAGRKSFRPDRALDQAMRAFWHSGYTGTSLSDLTSATGLGKGSLYATFGGKEQLFVACLHHYADTVASRLLAALHTHPDDPHRALAALFAAVLDRLADPDQPSGCLISDTAAECAALPVAVQETVRAQLDAQVDAVTAVLAAGRARGLLPHGAPDRLADFFVAVSQALALLHRAGTPVERLRGIADTALGQLRPAPDGRASGDGG